MTVSEYFDLPDWLSLRWHSASRLRRLWKWFRSCAVEQKSDFLQMSVSWDRFVYIWRAAVIPVEPVNNSDSIVKQIMSEKSRSASWLRKGNFLSINISFFTFGHTFIEIYKWQKIPFYTRTSSIIIASSRAMIKPKSIIKNNIITKTGFLRQVYEKKLLR